MAETNFRPHKKILPCIVLCCFGFSFVITFIIVVSGSSSMEDCCEDVERADELSTRPTPWLFSVEDKPPWLLSILLGLQHNLTAVGGFISMPFLLTSALCILENDPSKGYLISTTFMVSGISSLLQCIAGVRLPIIQGSSLAFLSCILAFLNLPQWTCPSHADLYAMGKENRTTEWQYRMQELQGAIISVSLLEMFIGYSGLVGLLLRRISPLTIAPTITLMGISMVTEAGKMASSNWYIAFATIFIVVLFSQFLQEIRTPLPWYTFSTGWHFRWIQGFQLFPVLLATSLVCGVCFTLRSYELLVAKDLGRTDLRLEALSKVDWFSIPYPFQWGWPRFTLNSILVMMAAVIVSIVESISDYYACARVCEKSAPPVRAINRGIGIVGVGCLIAGAFGAGPGVTSFSENIGVIGITKVGSRRVAICGALLMILLSVFGKVGAVFTLIPDPVVGGLLCVMFSVVVALGFSYLQHVNLKSHRNLFVLGSSMFFGIAIPKWLASYPEGFMTGYGIPDQLLTILFSTPIFVAALLGFLLDNILPGSYDERGVLPLFTHNEDPSGCSMSTTYDLPTFLNFSVFKKTGLYIATTTCAR